MATIETIFHTLLSKQIYESGQLIVFPANTVILNFNTYIKSIPIVHFPAIKFPIVTFITQFNLVNAYFYVRNKRIQ